MVKWLVPLVAGLVVFMVKHKEKEGGTFASIVAIAMMVPTEGR